jgi:antitoxin component YwqK of YwqJK toxin-antitoxin module
LLCLNIFNLTAQNGIYNSIIQSASEKDEEQDEMTLEEALKDKYIYWENGTPNEVVAIKKNVNTGYYEGYFENGTLAVKGKKKNQIKIGMWNYYYKNSTRKQSVRFNQEGDLLISKEYDKNGILTLEENLVDNNNNNTEYSVFESSYFENGKLIAKGRTLNDYKEGEWEFYNSDGEIFKTLLYKNDEVVSEIKIKKTEAKVSYKAKQEYSAYGSYVEKLERGWESSLWFPYDSYKEFDLKGNLIKRTYKESNDDIHQIYDFEYDNKNNCVKETIYWTKDDRHTNYEYEYDYDSNGNILQKYTTKDGNYNGKKNYRYDSSGNLIEELTYLNDDEFNYSYKKINVYDSNHNIISTIISFTDGEKYEETFTYDSKNNLTKNVTKNNSGTFDVINKKYDNNSNLIEEKEYKNKNLVKIWEYKYDDEGNKVEFIKSRYWEGEMTESKKYKYNYKNNELYETVIYIDDEPVFVIEREVIFYGDDY